MWSVFLGEPVGNLSEQQDDQYFLPFSSSLTCTCLYSEALGHLRSVIDQSKGLNVTSIRPLVLAAEENLHDMVVDLDKVVSKVRTDFFCLWMILSLKQEAASVRSVYNVVVAVMEW